MTYAAQLCALLGVFATLAHAAGYRTVGSSGCAAQMVFVPPYTDTVVFLDKYVNDQIHRTTYADGVQLSSQLWWPRSEPQDWCSLS